MSDQPTLAAAIRQARKRAGMSQVELAELLGIRQSSVSQWERGATKPKTAHLLALAAVLGVDVLGQLAGPPTPSDPAAPSPWAHQAPDGRSD